MNRVLGVALAAGVLVMPAGARAEDVSCGGIAPIIARCHTSFVARSDGNGTGVRAGPFEGSLNATISSATALIIWECEISDLHGQGHCHSSARGEWHAGQVVTIEAAAEGIGLWEVLAER